MVYLKRYFLQRFVCGVLAFVFVLFCGPNQLSAQDHITDSLWEKFNHLPPDSSRVDTILNNVLKLRNNLKNSPEEERMLQNALELAKELKYKAGIARCYNLLGIYYRETSRYGDAIAYHEKALEIGKKIRDSIIMGYALNSLGVAYRRLDDNQKAFQYHFEALGISKAIGNTRGRSIALNSIGNIHLSLGNYKEAIEEFKQGLEIEENMHNPIGQAINYANIGSAYEGLGQIDKAIDYYMKSLEYNTEGNSDKGIAICYNLLGEAYLKKGELDLALSYLQKAVSFNDKLRDRINVAQNDITIGKIYQKKNDQLKAMEYLNAGLSIAKIIGSQSLAIDAYEAIGESERLAGKFNDAYNSLQNAYELKDSLFKQLATPQMAKMRTLYELDKKEDQINILKQKNEINQLKLEKRTYLSIAIIIIFGLFLAGALFYLHYRRQKDYKLRLQYELQSLRSQMNPHFIFNALNSIDNFIWKREPEQASNYLVKFSNLMRMTLENSRTKHIPLTVEIEFLKSYLELENFRHNQKFKYEISVSPEIDGKNILIPSMVIQPFVENAILHGLSHKIDGDCNLSICFSRQDNLVKCVVEDNGIGRKNARVMRENQLVNKESLGIQVTEERVHLLKRITGNKNLQIQIIDLEELEKGKTGTRVVILLPLLTASATA